MNLRSLIPFGRARSLLGRRKAGPFTALQNEVDRLFDQFARGFPVSGTSDLFPSMDVTETDKQIELIAELPGIEAKDIEINFADNVLTIRGEKRVEKEEKDKHYYRVERSYGAFERSIKLPAGVDPNSIAATLANGLLKITIAKLAAAEAKKIAVKAA